MRYTNSSNYKLAGLNKGSNLRNLCSLLCCRRTRSKHAYFPLVLPSVRPSVCLSVCFVRDPNSKTKRRGKTKIGVTFPTAGVTGVLIFASKDQVSKSPDDENLRKMASPRVNVSWLQTLLGEILKVNTT